MHDEVLRELAARRAAGNPCCLATVVRVEAPTSCRPGDKALIADDGRVTGWIGGSCAAGIVRREALAALESGEARLIRIEPEKAEAAARSGESVFPTTCPSEGTIELFLEPHVAAPQLVAIGSSPAARTLLRLAGVMGYRTCAVHPGAQAADFPEADAVLGHFDLAHAGIGEDSWVVVATMGQYDEEALEAALATNAAYVGLVASRKRRNAVVQALRRRGWPGDALAGIVNPAGRALGDSQEEIALFVLAEIAGRRQRRVRRERVGVVLPVSEYARDPVCGMSVEVAGAQYRSGDVYFCGPGCLEAYNAHPENFALTS